MGMFDYVIVDFPCFYCGEELVFSDQVKGYWDAMHTFSIGDDLEHSGSGISSYLHNKIVCKACQKEETYSIVFINDIISSVAPIKYSEEIHKFLNEEEPIRIIFYKKELDNPELFFEKLKKIKIPDNPYEFIDLTKSKEELDIFIEKLKTP